MVPGVNWYRSDVAKKQYECSTCNTLYRNMRRNLSKYGGEWIGEKNLSKATQKWVAPPQSAPLPVKEEVKFRSGQTQQRDKNITKNGQWAYPVEVVDGCPVFDVGHFMPHGHPEGSNKLCNLMAVSKDINFLMGTKKKLPECTFYLQPDGSLILRFAPKWLGYPYYADREGRHITLDMLPPDPENRPQEKYVSWHNAEFEKFCRQSFTGGHK